MAIFDQLGRALRWLREAQGVRQYQIADTAGITKAMLSAYETGRQKPSLETLDKILVALGCDLRDLHRALDVFRIHNPGRLSAYAAERPPARSPVGPGAAGAAEVSTLLGFEQPLAPADERALEDVVESFHRFRVSRSRTVAASRTGIDEPQHLGGEEEEPS